MKKLSIHEENILEKIDFLLLLNGFAIIEDYGEVNQECFNELRNFYEETIYNSKNEEYLGGFCIRYENILKKNNQTFKGLLTHSLIQAVAQDYLKTNNFKIDVFQTLDNSNTFHSAQKPHFDRIPTLKFLLYLNDINLKNGPFSLSPGSHHWVRKKFPIPRENFNNEKLLENSRNLPDIILDNLQKITGKAGQLLIFTTDCVHHQGVVHSGETKIIRAHFRNPNVYYNKEKINFLDKIRKIKSSMQTFLIKN